MFVICGEALFDIFIPPGIADDSAELAFAARVGGSPFNVAVGLARLGRKSALFAGISTDFFGERLKAVLEKEKVSTALLSRKSGPTTLGFVQQDEAGHPSYAFYGAGAADRSLTNADLPSDLGDARCVHFGSYSIAVSPTADALQALALRETGDRIISLDPNIRLTVEPDLTVWRNRVSRLVETADVIKVSDEDLACLYPDTHPESIAETWLEKDVELLVLTRGRRGATLISKQSQIDVTAPKIQVVDTVGAGDTFQAGLLRQVLDLHNKAGSEWIKYLDTESLLTIGRYAAAAAAITCSRQGADLPTHTEVDQFLAEWA